MEEYAVKIQNLTKIYKLYAKPVDRLKEALNPAKKSYHKDFYALKDISFDIKKGQTIGIIGKNGSGKSTLLKILTDVLTPSSGEVEINGRISALLELGAGFNPEYTGIENIYLNGTVMGYSREEMSEKVGSIVEFADIGDFINQPVKNYSSGMFARLAFAVAINVDPDILIVDEALSVGDIYFQNKCYKKFDEFKEAGKTIIFVSHDLTSVIKYCEESVLLNEGEFIAKGDSNTIVNMFKKILANQFEVEVDELNKGANYNELPERNVPVSKEEGTNWKEKLTINNSALIYGDEKAKIVDFAIRNDEGEISNSIKKETRFEIVMKVHFDEEVLKPIFAFTIKDRKGTEITGTNTDFERIDVPTGSAGKDIIVRFEQLMNLHGGQYLLSLGCTEYSGDELVIHHRLYDICSVDVMSKKDTIGFFDTNSKITIA